MAYNIADAMKRKIHKLNEWRNRYEKVEYPQKVVINMFYEMYTIFFMWKHISDFFKQDFFSKTKKKFTNFRDAMNYVNDLKRQFQINNINPKLMQILRSNIPLGNQGITFENFNSIIEHAQSGENTQVEEIEYAYAYNSTLCELIFGWAACGLLGMNKHDAFVNVTGGDIGGIVLDSFPDVLDSINTIANFEIAENYIKLPSLWDEICAVCKSTDKLTEYVCMEVLRSRIIQEKHVRERISGKNEQFFILSNSEKINPDIVMKMGNLYCYWMKETEPTVVTLCSRICAIRYAEKNDVHLITKDGENLTPGSIILPHQKEIDEFKNEHSIQDKGFIL